MADEVQFEVNIYPTPVGSFFPTILDRTAAEKKKTRDSGQHSILVPGLGLSLMRMPSSPEGLLLLQIVCPIMFPVDMGGV